MRSFPSRRSMPRALIVGVGGLGCPAAWALARSRQLQLVLCDDDVVSESNLHRQVLFNEQDLGRKKIDAAAEALLAVGAPHVDTVDVRLVPETAAELVASCDIVLEGADNFGTKFLAADACYLARKPIVHGAGVRWHGTAWSVSEAGRPCYRCLFEDVLPADMAPNCSEAGVMGPAVGVIGAMMADLALDLLSEPPTTERQGRIFTFEARKPGWRAVAIAPRADCPLCGQNPTILGIDGARYWAPTCAAPPRVGQSIPQTVK